MKKFLILCLVSFFVFLSVQPLNADDDNKEFSFLADRFEDVQMLRLHSPDFDNFCFKKKMLCFYLYKAGLSGRDIIYDQNHKNNLLIREVITQIFDNYNASKDSKEYKAFVEYSKLFWFNNGLHRLYGNTKIVPKMSVEQFIKLMALSPNAKWPLKKGESYGSFLIKLETILFDKTFDNVHTAKGEGKDLVKESSVNFYEGITQKEAEEYYKANINKADVEPVMDGLNVKLVKRNGKVVARKYARNDLYGTALSEVVFWLEKAAGVADNINQEKYLRLLIDYFKTGDLKLFRLANIRWVQENESDIDLILGFIETYTDPLGKVGAFETVLHLKDQEASKKMKVIADNAGWFETNSPIMDAHKKKNIKGINFKVVNTLVGVGDASPRSPVGINLPNNEDLRERYGSKAVFLSNVKRAYNAMGGKSMLAEFCYSKEEVERAQKHGDYGYKLKVYFHEVLGHASGQLESGVADPSETLGTYAARNEEFRADINAVYWIADPKLIEIGLVKAEDHEELIKAAYDGYIRNGAMTQMRRIKPGKTLQQTHMSNRQTIALWAFELGKKENVIEKKVRDGKIYFVINDYKKLRDIFAIQLRESQRIKSQGDFKAAKNLFETYGTQLDPEVHNQVIERSKKFKAPNFGGFINPKLVLVDRNGNITENINDAVDVKLDYTQSFVEQMREYDKTYNHLPIINDAD